MPKKREKGAGDNFEDAGALQEVDESTEFEFYNVQGDKSTDHLTRIETTGLTAKALEAAKFINTVIKTLDKKGSTLVKLNPYRVEYAKKQLKVLRTKYKASEAKVAGELQEKAKKWLEEYIVNGLGENNEYF